MNTSLLLASQAAVALSARAGLPITWLRNGRLCIGSHTFTTCERLPTSPTAIYLATYVPPAKALVLQHQGINYLDTAGNAFIRATGLCLLIEGQKPLPPSPPSPPLVRLRLLYYLLSEPQLLQLPYRTISKLAGVALGSVSNFLTELRQQGLVEGTTNRRVLDTKALLARWVQEYAEVLRPTLSPQRYRWATAPGIRWQQLPMVTGTYWSGEPAARLLLQEKRFSPTSFIFYSPCLPDWGLVPDPVNGPVEILNPPLPLTALPSGRGRAATLLTYTDLLLSGRACDQQLAQSLRGRHLAHLL